MDVPLQSLRRHKMENNVTGMQQQVAPKSPTLTEELQDITECPICTEMYTDPRFLPCGHSFCLQCLEMQVVTLDKKPGDSFACPLCRHEFNILSSGLSALPRNFFLNRLSGLFQMSALSERKITCDHCDLSRTESMGEETRSYVQCEECYREQEHCRLTKDKPNAKEKSEIQHCKEHDAQPLDLYCLRCKKVICSSCATSHSQHNVEHVYKVAYQVTEEIQGYSVEADSFKWHFITRKQRMEEKKTEFLKELENTEAMIQRRSKVLKDIIDDHARTLLAELKTMQEAKLKEFEINNEELDRYLIEAESLMTYCSAIRSAQSPVAACYAINDVCARRKEIIWFCNSEILQKDQVIQVLFIHSELEDFLKTKCNNFVGKFEAKTVERVSHASGPRTRVQSKISTQFSAKLDIDYRKVFGVTTVQNYVYVLCQSPNGILVYDYEAPYVLKKEIAIKMIKSPFDIASSLKSHSLYIADKEKRIWKLRPNVQDEYNEHAAVKPSAWLRCLGQPLKLSVSRQGNILLVNSDCSLSLYSEDSQLISKIQLPPSVRQPMHACETSVGNVIICFKDCESLGICELDRSGLVLHSFLSKEGLPIDGPLHLLLDSDDRAFIADFGNDRVVVFDSYFSEHQVLLTEEKDEIFGPLGMCYDREKQQLMVAHGAGLNGATQVFIYGLTVVPLTAMCNPLMACK